MTGNIYKISEIAKILRAETWDEGLEGDQKIREIVFDSRQIFEPAHTLFLALKGETRNGHEFMQEAWDKGVTAFLVSDTAHLPKGAAYILVPDTLAALQSLAEYHRRRYELPVIGITGSNGKTMVKEWLASLLDQHYQLVKSPRSYNSQIGLPLSVLKMAEDSELAIMEAGISKAGEMERLEEILKPSMGIFTHFGDAHAEGFPSAEDKLKEKIKLFRNCEIVLAHDDSPAIPLLEAEEIPLKLIGESKKAHMRVTRIDNTGQGWNAVIEDGGRQFGVHIPVAGQAALRNGLLVALACRHFGLSYQTIKNGFMQLQPVSMRMEMISDNPEVTIINDAYNADVDSIHNAFTLLKSETSKRKKYLILSDILHQGKAQDEVHHQILDEAVRTFGKEKVILIGPEFEKICKDNGGPEHYPSTEEFLNTFDYTRFRDHMVLLKGARKFELEKIIPYLSRHVNATYFKINLNALSSNFRYFRKKLPAKTKLMAMVKAFSYGSGTWEIAQALEQERVDYLAVAYINEGIALRSKGIKVPIMVMNPDESGMDQLYHFNLEPEIYNLNLLERYIRTGKMNDHARMRIHLKVDTGMGRLGFTEAQISELADFLEIFPELEVVSVFSHLATADDPQQDSFTLKQIETFHKTCEELEKVVKKPFLRHILNTAGILRFTAHAMDMARLGIGLYGISPLGPEPGLTEIGSLHSVISQIHEYEPGKTVGYGASQELKRKSRVATVPIGYADGIPRRLSNGRVAFLVRGKPAPTVGKVCMDMLMLDITDIPEAREGDEVVIFGAQGDSFLSVSDIADACGTIPYEILTGIGQRVRRIYVRE